MNKILSAIRGVVGVSGVVLWDKITPSLHKILPARIEESETEQICDHISRYCSQYENNSRAIVRFERGWLVMYNHADFTILVVGKEDLSLVTLNLVLKSAINSLAVILDDGTIRNSSIKKLEPSQVAALVRAVNLSLAFFQGQVSRQLIAQLLRTTKTSLMEEYPILKHFTVDPNGGIMIIRGAEQNMNLTAINATAHLISGFLQLGAVELNSVGFDIEQETQELASILTPLGFYGSFKRAKGPSNNKKQRGPVFEKLPNTIR